MPNNVNLFCSSFLRLIQALYRCPSSDRSVFIQNQYLWQVEGHYLHLPEMTASANRFNSKMAEKPISKKPMKTIQIKKGYPPKVVGSPSTAITKGRAAYPSGAGSRTHPFFEAPPEGQKG